MANRKQRKYDNNHPDIIAVRKYEHDIAELKKKYDEANEAHDWCMRHFYYAQITSKSANLELLKQKIGNKHAICE